MIRETSLMTATDRFAMLRLDHSVKSSQERLQALEQAYAADDEVYLAAIIASFIDQNLVPIIVTAEPDGLIKGVKKIRR